MRSIKRMFISIFITAVLFSITTFPCLAVDIFQPSVQFHPLSCGTGTHFAITRERQLLAWGNDAYGTIGNSGTTYLQPNVLMNDAISVSWGQYVSYAIDCNGTLWGWGYDKHELLLGQQKSSPKGEAIKIMEDVISVSIGNQNAVVLKSDGTLWTWGANNVGQLGRGDLNPIGSPDYTWGYPPQQIMENVIFVAAYGDAVYAIQSDNSLWAWGDDTAIHNVGPVAEPQKLMDGISTIIPELNRVLIHTPDGNLYSVTKNGLYGDIHSELLLESVTYCNSGIAIREDGSLWVWNPNEINTERTIPQPVPSDIGDIIFAERGNPNTLLLTADGKLWQTDCDLNEFLPGNNEPQFTLIMDDVITPSPYKDVAVNDKDYSNILTCYQENIMFGVAPHLFAGEDYLTWEQGITVAVRLMALIEGNPIPAFDFEATWFAPYERYALSHSLVDSLSYAERTNRITWSEFLNLLEKAIPSDKISSDITISKLLSNTSLEYPSRLDVSIVISNLLNGLHV